MNDMSLIEATKTLISFFHLYGRHQLPQRNDSDLQANLGAAKVPESLAGYIASFSSNELVFMIGGPQSFIQLAHLMIGPKFEFVDPSCNSDLRDEAPIPGTERARCRFWDTRIASLKSFALVFIRHVLSIWLHTQLARYYDQGQIISLKLNPYNPQGGCFFVRSSNSACRLTLRAPCQVDWRLKQSDG